MSSVRFVIPKLRLEQLVFAPGGKTVAEALAGAEANLEPLKPTCRAELFALLAEAESLAAPGVRADNDLLADLYGLAVRGIGAGAVCGAPDVDKALGSLCDLVDHLQSGQRTDREALNVHLGAWRLLMDPDMPRPGAAAVLDGLRKVTARYAAAET